MFKLIEVYSTSDQNYRYIQIQKDIKACIPEMFHNFIILKFYVNGGLNWCMNKQYGYSATILKSIINNILNTLESSQDGRV